MRILLLTLVLGLQSVAAQVPSRENYFGSWYKLINQGISEDGKWNVFLKSYDNAENITVLINTVSKDSMTFVGASNQLLDNRRFVLLQRSGNLTLADLINGKKITVEKNVSNFFFTKNLTYGFAISRSKELFKIDKAHNVVKIMNDVFKIEELDDELLLVVGDTKTCLLSRKSGVTLANIDHITSNNFKGHTADTLHKMSKFLLLDKGKFRVEYYDWTGKRTFSKNLDDVLNKYSSFGFGNWDMLVATYRKPAISYKDSIELWHWEDKALKPNYDSRSVGAFESLLINVSTDQIVLNPSNKEVAQRYLIFQDKYLLEVLQFANGDFDTEFMVPSIRIRNVYTNEVEFQIKRTAQFFPTEYGVLFYFEGKDWWAYDIRTKVARNLTKQIGEDFYQFNRQNKNNIQPLETLNFSRDLLKVYLVSNRNVWEYNINSGMFKNLTRSEDPKVHFKILNRPKATSSGNLKWNNSLRIMEDYILVKLKHQDGIKEGLAIWHAGKLKTIENLDLYHFDGFVCGKDNFSYTRENANSPYTLKSYSVYQNLSKDIYTSNTEAFRANDFPKATFIPFKDANNVATYVSVILPPDYDKSKKYPAIVWIYENKAATFSTFSSPSYYNEPGFNRTVAALEGYIIILPRITYQINEPGESALRCVKTAIDVVSGYYNLDSKRLGLIGESFGGYETCYIIAHTDMFAAAIAGSALTDITASYFSVSKTNHRPNMWKYIDQSFRFDGDFYQNKKSYLDNNPIFNADKINTPLRLWAGKQDRHVDFEQSIAMFIALRSLNKPVELLLYPNEGHVLLRPENQYKATKYTLDWFDQYLK